MVTTTEYIYGGKAYASLTEAKSAAGTFMASLDTKPTLFISAKSVTKLADRKWQIPAGNGLSDTEILANPSGVFLCTLYTNSTTREITDLAAEVAKGKAEYITFTKCDTVYENTIVDDVLTETVEHKI